MVGAIMIAVHLHVPASSFQGLNATGRGMLNAIRLLWPLPTSFESWPLADNANGVILFALRDVGECRSLCSSRWSLSSIHARGPYSQGVEGSLLKGACLRNLVQWGVQMTRK